MVQHPLLQHVGQIAIPVQSLERAITFYQSNLGMTFLFRAGTLAFFDCGGIRLMLTLPETAAQQTSSLLYFTVDDIHHAYQHFCTQDVVFLDPPHCVAQMETGDLWMAFFQDSEHNTLAMMDERPRS